MILLIIILNTLGAVVSDAPYLHEIYAPTFYDYVGIIRTSSSSSTGSLIGPSTVLTAAHCVRGEESGKFELPDKNKHYYWASGNIIIHPTADIALINLDDFVSTDYYEIYTNKDEFDKTVIIIGYGMSGTGYTVQKGGDSVFPFGIKRIGYNKIIYAKYGYICYLFDSPFSVNSVGFDKESAVASGDSGGPTYIENNGLKIAGIHSMNIDFNGDGLWPNFGDKSKDVRISDYYDWISASTLKVGDINGDGVVNHEDFDVAIGMLDSTIYEEKYNLKADIDCDGEITSSDISILLTLIK